MAPQLGPFDSWLSEIDKALSTQRYWLRPNEDTQLTQRKKKTKNKQEATFGKISVDIYRKNKSCWVLCGFKCNRVTLVWIILGCWACMCVCVCVCVCVSAVRMSLFTPATFLLLHRGSVTDWVIVFCFLFFLRSVWVCVSRPGVRQVQRFLAGTRSRGKGGLMGVSVGCNGLSQEGLDRATSSHPDAETHTLTVLQASATKTTCFFFFFLLRRVNR